MKQQGKCLVTVDVVRFYDMLGPNTATWHFESSSYKNIGLHYNVKVVSVIGPDLMSFRTFKCHQKRNEIEVHFTRKGT